MELYGKHWYNGREFIFWLCAAIDTVIVTVRSRASGKTCLCQSRYILLNLEYRFLINQRHIRIVLA